MEYRNFTRRHVGVNEHSESQMLDYLGYKNIDDLIEDTIPTNIRLNDELSVGEGMSEFEYGKHITALANKNKQFRSFIGMGYYNTITPAVIQRNVFENPGWYTAYTPYQAEIAQGRLEALLNFQTMVVDLTGLPLANASLLDEATAASEAMLMFFHLRSRKQAKAGVNKFFVEENIFPQTVDVIISHANASGIELVVGDYSTFKADDSFFGAIVQYPSATGSATNYKDFAKSMNEAGIKLAVISDLMALSMLEEPGSWGADCVVGNTQRMGVPMGYGGPHAAFISTKEEFKRNLPGRIIGVSQDADGRPAFRMSLQTREQHIKREKATSNICTAQALLAVMASFYAVYHGPDGLKSITSQIHSKAVTLNEGITAAGYKAINDSFFDTVSFEASPEQIQTIRANAESKGINLRYFEGGFGLSADETMTLAEVNQVISVVGGAEANLFSAKTAIPADLERKSAFLTHPVFKSHHSETEMMRYVKKLENRDMSLTHSMISLGSCTMKLNAASEMMPLSHPGFLNIHPFVPVNQAQGYIDLIDELNKDLSEITGFAKMSFQPNSGAQGEYTGLKVIQAYHKDNNDLDRDLCLIPASAHGTNPASAIMAGMKVMIVKSLENGNIDVDDLREKAEANKESLAALMITYPSTHGVYEASVKEIMDIIHDNGGLVYMDGANMNAQVGLTSPGHIGADVCHLNLHKTFAIPHGGGGPGMGPIGVVEKLVPFLPNHSVIEVSGDKGIHGVSAAQFGSGLILPISYGYIKMLGTSGLEKSTKIAILNANYMRKKFEENGFDLLYKGERGCVAHEMIVDFRKYKAHGIEVVDVAKRLMDYGFHAPTVSFPVAGTLMIEPTESESKAELDRFLTAMISIKKEIEAVVDGSVDKEDNVLKNAPHTSRMISYDDWTKPYSRKEAAYPVDYLLDAKFWPFVRRIDDAFGDRNLVCSCLPVSAYED
ncbi:MAG: aminomethyl-transferring glycine dehydrogenase [Salibacteraceae bacterium]